MGADPGPYQHHALSRKRSPSMTQTGISRQAMRALLDARGIAVVGASQQPGRGSSVIANLRAARFSGEVVAHAGRIKALDLNPIIVRAEGEGVVAMDIAADRA